MPAPIRPSQPTPTPVRSSGGTVTVRAGDTLYGLAQRLLGDGRRWSELYELNKAVIGPNPRALKVGMVLRLPGATPPATPSTPPARPDADGDGLVDRYDAAPHNAADRRWTPAARAAFSTFVPRRVAELVREGIEIDCADFAVKLLADFCAAEGLPDPLAKTGSWYTYTPERPGGLPNVKGPNLIHTGVHADRLAKQYTKPVNDANGNGVAGMDPASKAVDVGDLRPGDLLFYDWDGDGVVNHTLNVVGLGADGSVTVAWGTYDNLKPSASPVAWENLDLQPVQVLTIKPGSAEYAKYLGAGSALWGVRRYTWMPDEAVVTPAPSPAPAPAPHGWRAWLERLRRAWGMPGNK